MLERLSFFLGLFASVWAVFDIWQKVRENHTKISVTITAWHCADDCLFIFATFKNHSHLPISISLVSAELDGVPVQCSLLPKTVYYEQLPGEPGRLLPPEPVRSLPFPLNLDPLGGVAGYLYFRTDQAIQEKPSTLLTLELCTNRRGPMKCQCTLQWDDLLHTRYFPVSSQSS
ncbi:MAG: hypothetical protein J6O73_07745 [Lachnospiraceae bacterium]|nr:hypothetical protein [Lachnospiraceae bacterium]